MESAIAEGTPRVEQLARAEQVCNTQTVLEGDRSLRRGPMFLREVGVLYVSGDAETDGTELYSNKYTISCKNN